MQPEHQEHEAFSSRRRTWVILLLIAIAVIALSAFLSSRRTVVPVRTFQTERATITSAISTNGKIEPANNFEAHAPAPTTVKRLLVKEGDQVKRGQLLLQLDDSDARAQAARALAQVRSAEADLHAIETGGTKEEVLTNRSELARARSDVQAAQRNLDALRNLEQTGAASPAEVRDAEQRLQTAQSQVNLLRQKTTDRYSSADMQRAEAELQQATAAYSAAQDTLRKSNVVSPIDGTIYSLPVKQGNFVNTGDLLLQVADLKKVVLHAFVDEPDLGRLALGEHVAVTWDALPGRTWQGTVAQIPTTVTVRGSRTVGDVTCDVQNPDQRLLPNINVNVNITTAKADNAIVVPREAVHQEDGKRYVYEVLDDKLRIRYVDTGISNLTGIEITRGLAPNAQIALGSTNGRPLRDGLPIRIVQ
ncbi:MAG TPA: efflux RND transporter periplasmic adaptor subunit [Terriglobales bacterium]|nr:efflux RND transporter periplasmic adaptor subunit [Terriglobales bacterium]